MRRCSWFQLGCGVLAASFCTTFARAATWFPLGPYGGSARSFAMDPADTRHLFLGTASGWVYDSHDGGLHWNRVAQISKRNDLVIDHIVADRDNPKRLVVGAYTVDHLRDGGIFISEDYGKTWYAQAEMRGQSVRSLSRSPSDPKELIAGTLRGVFRSRDNGVHWQQISPADSTEIKEVQSIAIDPADPGTIYAGTWHLPWKTTDGGATWSNIKDGIIDDSDVFSIIVDPKDPKIVYASACSGIYKSADAGGLFHKVQGIPSAARRTRTLEQDPTNLNVVYAGTTEGLYRTEDAGVHWDRLTGDDVIVNDVFVDPQNDKHVLIATDRGGVFRSEDAGATFEASNDGFSARQVIAYAADAQRNGAVYVGVVNDKTTGGVFESKDGGVRWQQVSEGLGGRDVFSLISLQDGTLLAGTGHGIFRMQDAAWQDSSGLEGGPVARTPEAPDTVGPTSPTPLRLHSPGPVRHAPVPSHSKSGPPSEHTSVKPSTTRKGVTGRSTLRKGSAVRAPQGKAGKVRPAMAVRFSAGAGTPHLLLAALQKRVMPPKKPAVKTATKHTGASASRAHPAALHSSSARTSAKKIVPPRTHGLLTSASRSASPQKGVATGAEARPAARNESSNRLDAVVYALAQSETVLYAGTSSGLLRSVDLGQHWSAVRTLAMPDVHYLAAMNAQKSSQPGAAPMILAAGLQRLTLSPDGGNSWDTVALPADLTQIGAATIDGEGNLWVGGREGVWYSTDYGSTWKTLRNLFLTEVDSLFYDGVANRLLVTSSTSPVAFSVSMGEHKVTYWDTGWKLRFVRPVGDHLLGATLFDGMVVEPKMVDSPVASATGSSH